jgi:arginine utilization regulatory protein
LEARSFRAKLRHAADSLAPVWLHGEPGSGKATAARVIHHNGPRREQPFVRIDCAALQPYLIEALLFGTGGLANADRIGTLFLRNPAALPRDLQQKLSDWLLSSPKPPRVISSSLKPACEDVEAGILRDEYASQLNVIELSPLPLRMRFEELPGIVERTLRCFNKPFAFESDLEKTLMSHLWPGNLHELRTALSATAVPVSVANLPRYLKEKTLTLEPVAKVPRPSLDAVLEAVEKKLLKQTLAECGGNQTEAAQRLGIHRARLIRRLDALGLSRSE